jgi:predicted GNAT family acetyltransferase
MTDIDLEKIEVIHNDAENQFETRIDGQLSKLDYSLSGNTIVMTHVGVHPKHRGRGVAGKLAQVGLEYAIKNSLRVIPMCPYIAAYIRRNPQYKYLLEQQTGNRV